jgi:hypothetical protein
LGRVFRAVLEGVATVCRTGRRNGVLSDAARQGIPTRLGGRAGQTGRQSTTTCLARTMNTPSRPSIPPHQRLMPRWTARPVAAFALAAAACIAGPALATAPEGDALHQRHDELRSALANSPFGRPLVLSSSDSASRPHGEVHAVLKQPFNRVAEALKRPEAWCEVMMLQTNIKRCEATGGEVLHVAIARRHDQPVDQAYQVDFVHKVRDASAQHLLVETAASAGPLGTSDYKLGFEAVPLDAGTTFVRMSYGYSAGVAARLASQAYLSTSGRDKVGFSVVGKDEAGRPLLVGGSRGVAERNTMRYYLALESVLATMALPPEQRAERRLREWYAAVERYPRQLREMSREEYLTMKRRELQLG